MTPPERPLLRARSRPDTLPRLLGRTRPRTPRARSARSRALLQQLVRVPGCLALACGLLLGAGAGDAVADGPGSATLDGQVSPVDTQVAPAQNGDFTLTVTNTGTLTADNVRVLLDDGQEGNGVGSPDGRCLSRLDAASPADLWCELGDLAPQQSAVVNVHAYMLQCVWDDPAGPTPRLHAPAFHWRVAYADAGQARTMNGPTPRWSC
jgi:hypothetical protein